MTSLNFRTNTYDTVTSTYQITKSRRCCLFHSAGNSLFFSLVDYRNNYFTSYDPDKIIEFYNGFENRDQLIQWMNERPKGVANIHEIDGDKDIIVVIPTADFNGKYARECRENIFRGLHIIFVESAEIPDPYFNGAHNVNVGIKKALEYNPKWIVFSNDDMIQLDSVKVLKERLSELDENKYDVVLAKPSDYHSATEKVAKSNLLFKIYLTVYKNMGRNSMKIHKKFRISYFPAPTSGIYSMLFRKGYIFTEIQDFAIYSGKWAKDREGNIYDETYINAMEDTDLSIFFSLHKERTTMIDYKIGDLIGSTLGTGLMRDLSSIVGISYFNFKWEHFFTET